MQKGEKLVKMAKEIEGMKSLADAKQKALEVITEEYLINDINKKRTPAEVAWTVGQVGMKMMGLGVI
jgi:hypothetical protein